MPVVLVHGNPETPAIWSDLRSHLKAGPVITLSPPGFGAPLPGGFGATSDDYVTWLAGELQKIQGPIDLVGHDWGGGHVARLACSQPDLVRSWTTDIAGCLNPEYVWHDFAQIWQKPGEGEEAIRQMVETPLDARVAQYESLGMSPHVAREVAAAMNEDMGKAILALYRSAAQPAMANWGKEMPKAAARPGLVLIPTGDHFTGGETLARRTAERAKAKVTVLEGLGHWWMCENPKRGAEALDGFFAGLN
jgi:pimeloyl-ACP methyl ester carboxylesterase